MSSILLSSQEVEDLNRMCNDPMLELGMMLRPKHSNCLKPKIATSTMMTIIRFDRHEDAKKWHTMQEERIRMGGHLATITLSILVGLLSRIVTAGIAASASSGILKDEMQARIWYPEVFQGWLLTRYYTFRYEQYPHQNFYMEWTDVIQDETGKERERHKHTQSH